MLYNASEKELSNLSKQELRILRNAFYARLGYIFKSKDLIDFFSQFSWYNQLIESNIFFEITNSNIVASIVDQKRIELIQNIEKSKN